MTAVLSRRGVLGAGAVAVGAGLAAGSLPAAASSSTSPVSTGASAAASAPSTDPLAPVRSLFASREGEVFTGTSPWSEHRLVLASVGDLPGGGDVENRFRVTFTTDAGARDGLYRLTQDGALAASLFLVRVTDAPTLEAVVDRRGGAA